MPKNIFLHSLRDTPTAEVPYVSRNRKESVIASSSRSSPVSGTSVQLPLTILDDTSKYFPKLKATGRSLLITFKSPNEE